MSMFVIASTKLVLSLSASNKTFWIEKEEKNNNLSYGTFYKSIILLLRCK